MCDEIVCVVGVGLGCAMLKDDDKFKTETMIDEAVKANADAFPILSLLFRDDKSSRFASNLNYVWTHLEEFGRVALADYACILQKHGMRPGIFGDGLELLKPLYSPSQVISILLEWELKRLIATVYANHGSKQQVRDFVGKSIGRTVHRDIRQFIEWLRDKNVTWISLNYDTVLEEMLEKLHVEWEYWFQSLISGFGRTSSKHVIVKPHGSLNVWFRSDWPGTATSIGQPEKRREVFTHALGFACERQQGTHLFSQSRIPSRLDLLETCPASQIHVLQDSPLGPSGGRRDSWFYEFRPWLVGYVPDDMQLEVNTPGIFADPAHDLCKANLGCAGLTLMRAKQLYIFGYSMPPEDRFFWNRIEALPRENKSRLSVRIASGKDTIRCIDKMKSLGIGDVGTWCSSPYYV